MHLISWFTANSVEVDAFDMILFVGKEAMVVVENDILWTHS